jgi:hypothetical protein
MALVASTEMRCPFFLVEELKLELELSVELLTQQSQRLLGLERWLLLPASR